MASSNEMNMNVIHRLTYNTTKMRETSIVMSLVFFHVLNVNRLIEDVEPYIDTYSLVDHH